MDTGGYSKKQTRSQKAARLRRCGNLASEEGRVFLGVGLPFFRQVVCGEDGRNRTHRNTGTAIDALDGIDKELLLIGIRSLVLFRVDTVYRARIHAGRVLCADTGFSNYICHDSFLRLQVIEIIVSGARRTDGRAFGAEKLFYQESSTALALRA
jgi:hypothetical protein